MVGVKVELARLSHVLGSRHTGDAAGTTLCREWGGVDICTGSTAFFAASFHITTIIICSQFILCSRPVALLGLLTLQGAADPTPPDRSGGYPSRCSAGHCAPIWCAKG